MAKRDKDDYNYAKIALCVMLPGIMLLGLGPFIFLFGIGVKPVLWFSPKRYKKILMIDEDQMIDNFKC